MYVDGSRKALLADWRNKKRGMKDIDNKENLGMNGRAMRTMRGATIKDMQAYLQAQLEERDKKLLSMIQGERKMQDTMSSENYQVLQKLMKHFYETHEKTVENLIFENPEDEEMEEDANTNRQEEEKRAALLTPYSKSIKGRGLLEKASKYEKAKRYEKALSIYRRGKLPQFVRTNVICNTWPVSLRWVVALY